MWKTTQDHQGHFCPKFGNKKPISVRIMRYWRLGSRWPSTVTLMALCKVATWGGDVSTMMERVKLLPETMKKNWLQNILQIKHFSDLSLFTKLWQSPDVYCSDNVFFFSYQGQCILSCCSFLYLCRCGPQSAGRWSERSRASWWPWRCATLRCCCLRFLPSLSPPHRLARRRPAPLPDAHHGPSNINVSLQNVFFSSFLFFFPLHYINAVMMQSIPINTVTAAHRESSREGLVAPPVLWQAAA